MCDQNFTVNQYYIVIILITCTQILKEDDTFWPQPDKVGRQVSRFSTF